MDEKRASVCQYDCIFLALAQQRLRICLASVRLSVCPSVYPSMSPQQQTRCCRFAAVGPVGRRYRSTAARRVAARRATGECG